MFQTVPSVGAAPCREHPDAFRLHRKAQFSIFSRETLQSYHNDITRARRDNINLMTLKYARMDNLVPPVNTSPLIDAIADIMVAWQLAWGAKHPNLMTRARPVTSETATHFQISFETYLRGELETYSEQTLAFLFRDLQQLQAEGKNGSEEIYRFLAREMNRDAALI